MSLTPNEAADALRDIESTSRRSGEAFGYRMSAPFLIIWGLVWVVGYGVSDLAPRLTGIVWPAVLVAGTVVSFIVGRYFVGNRSPQGWRFLALVPVVWLFLFATYAVMGPLNDRQQAAFVPLVIAALYSGLGLWIGVRYLITGIAVAALTLFGFFYLHQHFELWMAAVGGGGLILAGLWMRNA